MNKRKQFISCEVIKKTDIVNDLVRLCFQPKKISRTDHWHLSTLRVEKTLSLKLIEQKIAGMSSELARQKTLLLS